MDEFDSVNDNNDNVITKAEYIYRQLKKKIVSGALVEGQHIIINEVAKEMDSSTIPVREALKRLQAEGFLEHIPHKGMRVIQNDTKRLLEVVGVRSVLESYATRLAAEHMEPACIDELRSINSKLLEFAEKGDSKQYTHYNHIFHLVIYRKSGNSLLVRTIEDLWTGGKWSGEIFADFPDRMIKSYREHNEIIRCLAKGDGDAASKIIEASKSTNLELYSAVAKHALDT